MNIPLFPDRVKRAIITIRKFFEKNLGRIKMAEEEEKGNCRIFDFFEEKKAREHKGRVESIREASERAANRYLEYFTPEVSNLSSVAELEKLKVLFKKSFDKEMTPEEIKLFEAFYRRALINHGLY